MFMLCTFTYVDLKSLTIWSTNVWDVLFYGRFQDFYAYSALNLHDVPHQFMGGDMIAILPWAVWNFPIWAIQNFFHIEIIKSPWLMLWSKLFLVAAYAVLMRYVYKLALLIVGKENKNKAMTTVFLSASSLYFFTGIGYGGQNDIIFLLPAVMGIYALLKEDAKPWLFYVCTAFSITVKPFFVFPYVAILLLCDKRISRILLRILYGFSGLILSRIVFSTFPFYKESIASGPTEKVIGRLFDRGIQTGFGHTSIFLLGLAALYLWCYLSKPENRKKMISCVIYSSTAAFMLLVLTTYSEFYRAIVLAPFVPLMMLSSRETFNLSAILDTLMSILIQFSFWFNEFSSYKPTQIQPIYPFPKIAPSARQYIDPLAFLEENVPYLRPAFAAGVVACGAALLLLCHPSGFIKTKIEGGNRCQRGIFWARIVSPLFFTAVTFWFYFWVK